MTESLSFSVFAPKEIDDGLRVDENRHKVQVLWQTAYRQLCAGDLDTALATLARAKTMAHAHLDPLENAIDKAAALAARWREIALKRQQHRLTIELDEREMHSTRTQIELLMSQAAVAVPRQNLLSRIIAIAGKRSPSVEFSQTAAESYAPENDSALNVHTAVPTETLQVVANYAVSPSAQPRMTVRMLGAFQVAIDHLPVQRCANSRARSVLAYLVTNRDAAVPRDQLMDEFWRDADPKNARNSLNVALHYLRNACKVEDDLPVVVHKNGAYQLNPDIDVWTDVDEFVNHSEHGKQLEALEKTDDAISLYEQALLLYQGDFLSDSPYEDWAVLYRENLRVLYLDVLDRLSVIYLECEQYAACITLCQLMLVRDNCREDAHCRLMRCYARQNQAYLSLRQYQVCVDALRKELDVPPSALTTELCECIRRRERV